MRGCPDSSVDFNYEWSVTMYVYQYIEPGNEMYVWSLFLSKMYVCMWKNMKFDKRTLQYRKNNL